MSNTMRRVAAGLVTVVAAGALSMAAAAPAQATASDCATYLKARGYLVGPKVQAACKQGASGTAFAQLICTSNLVKIQVSSAHAGHACKLAAVK